LAAASTRPRRPSGFRCRFPGRCAEQPALRAARQRRGAGVGNFAARSGVYASRWRICVRTQDRGQARRFSVSGRGEDPI